jgi:hypothetical protein
MEFCEMEFVECPACASKHGVTDLCESCLSNRSTIEKLNQHIKKLENEIKTDDALLEERERLLNAIPECTVHGVGCIPHAVEWIERVKTLGLVIFCKNDM